MSNQNLGINLKKFQYFHNTSITSFQNHYKPLLRNYIILYDFLKKKGQKCISDKNALILRDHFSYFCGWIQSLEHGYCLVIYC